MAILMNEDYEHFMVWHPVEEMNEAGLRKQVDNYFQGQVDTVFFNVNAQRAYYDSHVFEPVWKGIEQRGDGKWYHRGVEFENKPLPTRTNTVNAKLLHENTSGQAFQIRIDQCRKHGGHGGISIRMNDCHLANLPYSPMHSDLWFEHPEWRLSEEDGGGLNLAIPEVRRKLMDLLDEVFQKFDMDALELDWMRSPPFYRNGHDEENIPNANELVRHAFERKILAEKRLGHPVTLAVRVPSRPDEALLLGLDSVFWAKSGWVDLVIPCGYIFCTDSNMPLKVWRDLLPEKVRIVPGIDIVTMSHRNSRGMENCKDTLEILFGYAASFFYRGAKDVYLFNHMDQVSNGVLAQPYGYMMQHIGERETVENQARRHVVTMCMNMVPGIPWHSCLPLDAIECLQKVRLEVGGNVRGRNATLCLAFEADDSFDPDNFEIMVNEVPCPVSGQEFPYAIPDPSWKKLVCAIPENTLTEGSAVVGFRIKKPAKATLRWCEIELQKKI